VRIGGAVAVWVKLDNINNVERYYPKIPLIGSQEVWLILKDINLLLVSVYIPPKIANLSIHACSINNHLIENCDIVLLKYPDVHICIVGDFNRLNCDDLCANLNLLNCVTQPTRQRAILDKFFCSEDFASNYEIEVQAPLHNSDHNIVFARASHNDAQRRLNRIFKTVYDLRLSHITYFCDVLSNINWRDFYLAQNDIHSKCTTLNEIISDVITHCIPTNVVEQNDLDEQWVSPVLKNILIQRDKAFKNKNTSLYNHLCGKVEIEIAKSKEIWAKKAEKGSRQLWRVVHDISGTNRSNPINNLYNKYENMNVAVNEINSSLSQIFRNPSTYLLDQTKMNILDWNCTVTVDQVFKALSSIQPGKAYGNDFVPSILYKAAADSLAGPLAHIYNLSIEESIFPAPWKYGHTVVLPKTSKPNISDVRPITLLTAPSKLLERFVLNSVASHMHNNAGPNQFCKPKSSTLCALITLHDHVTRLLDNPDIYGVSIISYDFSKCFDIIQHDVILRRLIDCEFPKPFIQWIKSYLSNRSQSVRIANHISSPVRVTSGVPQGSVLGPPLWNLVAGSFKCPIDSLSEFIIYVDDFDFIFPLFKKGTNHHIRNGHESFLDWANTKKLVINPDKCKILNIIPPGTRTDLYHFDFFPDLPIVDELRLLGVHFNNHLNWNSHINYVIKNATQKLYAIRKLRPIVSNNNLKQIYNAIIRSIIEYCSPLYISLPSELEQKLQKVQNRFHYILCGRNANCKADECLPALAHRKQIAAEKLLSKVMNNPTHVLRPLLPQTSSRSNRFIIPFAKTTRRQNSFFNHMVLQNDGAKV
jgi:hypothetical protein